MEHYSHREGRHLMGETQLVIGHPLTLSQLDLLVAVLCAQIQGGDTGISLRLALASQGGVFRLIVFFCSRN